MKTIKIGNYEVDEDDVWSYIDHFGRDKSNIQAWEKMRKQLHDYIFEKLELDRFSDEGQEFCRLFDEWAEPHILKYDPIVAGAKKLSNAKTKKDIDVAQYNLQFLMKKQEMLDRLGGRNFNAKDTNTCRVCGKDLVEGIPRYNDHLMCPSGFDEIHSPICSDCASNKPDKYHIAFKNLKL